MVSNWEPAQFVGRCCLWGQDCSNPLPSSSGCHMPVSLPSGRDSPLQQLACCSWYSLNPSLCEHTRDRHVVLEPFEGKVFFFLSLGSPWFGLLSQISSLRLSSGHSGLVLVMSLYATSPSPLVVAVWHIFFGFFFFFFFSWLCCPLRFQKLLTDMPVRGLSTVWKLLLLHDSLPRLGLHP